MPRKHKKPPALALEVSDSSGPPGEPAAHESAEEEDLMSPGFLHEMDAALASMSTKPLSPTRSGSTAPSSSPSWHSLVGEESVEVELERRMDAHQAALDHQAASEAAAAKAAAEVVRSGWFVDVSHVAEGGFHDSPAAASRACTGRRRRSGRGAQMAALKAEEERILAELAALEASEASADSQPEAAAEAKGELRWVEITHGGWVGGHRGGDKEGQGVLTVYSRRDAHGRGAPDAILHRTTCLHCVVRELQTWEE